MLEPILFYTLSFILLTAALFVITRTNPIAAALGMVVALVSLAGLYGLLNAGVIAAIQILVYTGGILVLIIFVIMILSPKERGVLELSPRMLPLLLGILGGILLLVPVIIIFLSHDFSVSSGISEQLNVSLSSSKQELGDLFSIADFLFANYLFPFEMLSLLLLAAVTGVLVLARRNL